MTDEWLDFVVDCRQGVTHQYDIVEGPMADDQIWDYVEDFIEGTEYCIYFVTDGYNAIPLMSVVPYKYSLEGSGGIITPGMGAYAPAQSIDRNKIQEILQNIIYPTLREIAKNNNPYIGILGVNIIMTPYDKIYTLGFKFGIDNPDIDVILPLIKTDLLKIIRAAIVGSLADDYSEFEVYDKAAVAANLLSPNYWKTNIKNSIITGVDDLDDDIVVILNDVRKNQYLEYETSGVNNMTLCVTASTLGNARRKLYDNIDRIQYNDKKYLKDVAATTCSKW